MWTPVSPPPTLSSCFALTRAAETVVYHFRFVHFHLGHLQVSQQLNPEEGKPYTAVAFAKALPATSYSPRQAYTKIAKRLFLGSSMTVASLLHTQSERKQVFDLSLVGDNLTYNLWNFGPLRILVRCRIPSFVPDPAPPGFRYCCVQAKLDYLPALGPEDLASHEARHLWIYNYLRPGSCSSLQMPTFNWRGWTPGPQQ